MPRVDPRERECNKSKFTVEVVDDQFPALFLLLLRWSLHARTDVVQA